VKCDKDNLVQAQHALRSTVRMLVTSIVKRRALVLTERQRSELNRRVDLTTDMAFNSWRRNPFAGDFGMYVTKCVTARVHQFALENL
jgi:hypothetical protein